MKRIIYLIIILVFATSANAQYDPDALKVLNAMSAKYQKINAFSATFSQELINKAASIKEEIEGEITVKDDMYVLKISGQEIYNNGTDVFSYNPDINEVTVDTYVAEQQEITLGNIWDLYQDGFKYGLMAVNRNGDRVIELDPEDKEKSYYKIRMIIGAENNLKEFTVFEHSGNQYIYTIENFQQKPSIQDDYFTFDPAEYEDVEVIDFR